MHLNRITLIGFIGSDAERKPAKRNQHRDLFAGDQDVLEERCRNLGSRTEWHRCVAFGKLADFAGTLSKGAHVAIEGELRSHEYYSSPQNLDQAIS
jgi:single-strand DNA-binding protein